MTKGRDTLDKGMIHVPGRPRCHHATQNSVQLKTYWSFLEFSILYLQTKVDCGWLKPRKVKPWVRGLTVLIRVPLIFDSWPGLLHARLMNHLISIHWYHLLRCSRSKSSRHFLSSFSKLIPLASRVSARSKIHLDSAPFLYHLVQAVISQLESCKSLRGVTPLLLPSSPSSIQLKK